MTLLRWIGACALVLVVATPCVAQAPAGAIVFTAIGLPLIAGGAITGALVDAAIRTTVFRFAGTRGIAGFQVSPVLGDRRAGALATIRF